MIGGFAPNRQIGAVGGKWRTLNVPIFIVNHLILGYKLQDKFCAENIVVTPKSKMAA